MQNLAVSFGTETGPVRAVNDTSFKIDAGETLALVGESGSGKSVTALSILKLLGDAGHIDQGSIFFDGRDLAGVDEREMRRIRGNRISMIFQEPMTSLNPVIQVGRQVAEPLVLHRGLSWADALREAESLLRKVAIPDPESRLRAYPHQLSGGMRQRIMIAMALACGPELIIADEPTTALDVTVQAQILALLKALTDESGAAMLLITHDLGVVARYADRVAVMYAGRIVEAAPARELYAQPRHPYTEALLRSVPRLDSPEDHRLAAIEGQPPDLAHLPPGCAFAPRCPQRFGACTERRPEATALTSKHTVACLHHES